MASLFLPTTPCRSPFAAVVAAFLTQPGLPFASVLSAERLERIFARHGNLFGLHTIYSTAVTLWAFLGQILRDGTAASCRAAVANIIVHRQLAGLSVPTADTGDYCRARAKLALPALRDVAVEVAAEVEEQAPAAWLWKGYHAQLIDGFTVTMPDTATNQAAFPQLTSQAPGVGFPIARVTTIVSLATACVTDLAVGRYQGKTTGETALLRQLLGSFHTGDVAVLDRYYGSFLMIALLLQRGVSVCTRLHQRRRADFRRGRRLGPGDRLVVWTRPSRPDWLDEATYEQVPEQLTLRLLRYQVVEPGRRTEEMLIVTTLTDAEQYPKADIAELYGFRWQVELDIRSIKQSLSLEHVRCQTPVMVQRELWLTILGYNLIRTTAAAAAALHGRRPRQLSFTSTCQYVLAAWPILTAGVLAAESLTDMLRTVLHRIASCVVGDRPGRIEPRVIKRRRHRYPLMQQPRAVLRAQLQGQP